MRLFEVALNEYLTAEQRYSYEGIEIDPEVRAATDHYFGVGVDMKREEITDPAGELEEKSEIHQAIEKALNQEISNADYKRGMIKDRYGRDVKIGKLIKDSNLRNQYASDNTKAGTKKSGYYITVHRGIEVAGQTNGTPNITHPRGHSWGQHSCKNLLTGCNRKYLIPEIESGTVVLFVHDHSGQEIYRATLQPHTNNAGVYAYALDAQYGVKTAIFTKHAMDIAKRLSSEHSGPNLYVKHRRVYNDSGKMSMLHPNTSLNDLMEIMDKGDVEEQALVLEKLNAPNSNVSPDMVTKILDLALQPEQSARIQILALQNPTINLDQITRVLTSGPGHLMRAVMKNKLVTEDLVRIAFKRTDLQSDDRAQIVSSNRFPQSLYHQVLLDSDENVRGELTGKNDLPVAIFDALLADTEPSIRQAAVSYHPELLDSVMLVKMLCDESPMVRRAAFRSPKVRESSLLDAFKTTTRPSVRMACLNHHRAPEEILKLAAENPHSTNGELSEVANSNNSTGEILEILAKRPDADDKVHLETVMSHRNATPAVLAVGLASEDPYLRGMAAQNKNISSEQLTAALKDPKWEVVHYALQNYELTRSQLEIAKTHPNAGGVTLKSSLESAERRVVDLENRAAFDKKHGFDLRSIEF